MDEPTPSEIRALAAAAGQLSRDVDELHARLKDTAADPARRGRVPARHHRRRAAPR